ncbi:hypothetical protein BJX64DRAFT_272344 [Aspergillus heterothallicus]
MKGNFPPNRVLRQGRQLGYLCRSRHFFATLYGAARDIAGLKGVKIVLLSRYNAREVPSQLKSACLKVRSVKRSEKLEKELGKRKWVHAEIRMVLHLLGTEIAAPIFPYLGISKKTCLLCGHVLSQLGGFKARNNHGKVYGQWTLPQVVAVPEAAYGRMDTTIQRIREALQQECNSKDTG